MISLQITISRPVTELLRFTRDNVFVERLWRSVKYEEVYLRAYESVADAKSGIDKYFLFYNSRRPHTALDGATPDTVYFESQPLAAAA